MHKEGEGEGRVKGERGGEGETQREEVPSCSDIFRIHVVQASSVGWVWVGLGGSGWVLQSLLEAVHVDIIVMSSVRRVGT